MKRIIKANTFTAEEFSYYEVEQLISLGLSEIGGEHFDTITPDEDIYEFNKGTSRIKIVTELCKRLNAHGYQTQFFTASGKVSEKPTKNFRVCKPGTDYEGVDVNIFTSSENSYPGKVYYIISIMYVE